MTKRFLDWNQTTIIIVHFPELATLTLDYNNEFFHLIFIAIIIFFAFDIVRLHSKFKVFSTVSIQHLYDFNAIGNEEQKKTSISPSLRIVQILWKPNHIGYYKM